MLGEAVGDVHRPGLTLMWGVEALREAGKRKRGDKSGGKFKRSLIWILNNLVRLKDSISLMNIP